MSELPQGWVSATISDVTSYVQRGKSPKYVQRSELPVVNQKCVRWWGIDEAHLKYVDPSQWDAWGEERFLRQGDILWNSTGTGTIGRAALYRGLKSCRRAVVDSHVTIVRSNDAVIGDYLHRLIQSRLVQDKIDDMQSGSTNQVELSRSEVLNTSVPLPPLPEQRRIVAKIDSLSAKSRRARDHLNHIPRLVEKYKQAILAAAFRGELTRDWSLTEPPSDDDLAGAKLKLCAELRCRPWKLSETPPKVLLAPGRWKRCYVGQVVAHRSGIAFESKDFTTSGLQVVRLGNLYQARLDLARQPVFITNLAKYDAFTTRSGDILVSQTGTKYKRDYGHFVVIPAEVRVLVNQRVVCLTPTKHLNASFLALFSQTDAFREHFFGHETGGVSQGNVGLAGILDAPFALPSRPEQDEIVRRIGLAFSFIDRLSSEASSARKLIGHLDEAVLAKAFRGELVPQDPNDEPVSALLERIKAEREAAKAQPRKAKQQN